MKKTILFLSTILVVILIQNALTSSSSGQMGAATSGSGCGGGSCHLTKNTLTSVGLQVDGSAPPSSYTPGKKYSINVSLINSNYQSTPNRAGFDIIFSKGTISGNPASTMIMTSMSTTEVELHHTSPQSMVSGLASWTFDWTAPGAGAGAVTIDLAGNVTDGQSNTTGDAWNDINTVTLTEGAATAKPIITGLSVTNKADVSATLNSSVNANGLGTRDTFEYGTSTAYGTVLIPTPTPLTTSSAVARSVNVTGLTPGTLYHYRVRASNSAGQTVTADQTFTTNSATAPVITNIAVPTANITNTSAKITASVKANSTTPTSISIAYGTTDTYGSVANTTPATATGTSNVAVSATLSGLSKNTTYHYQVIAKNSKDSTKSADATFTTTNTGSILSFEASEVLLYPNPTTEYLYIAVNNTKEIKKAFAVNLEGKSIFLDIQRINSDHYKASTRNLGSGVYFIRLETMDGLIQNSKPITIE